MKNFKSPIRYPGGKSKLAKKIFPYVPNNIKEYREPFFGGGSMYFFMRNQKTLIDTWKASDTFKELVTFWNEAKNNNLKLHALVTKKRNEFLDNGKELHLLSRNLIYKNDTTNLDLAASFFILNRISFSGLTLSGGYSKASFESRFKTSHIESLKNVEPALKNLDITQNDYTHLLYKESDYKKEDILIYLDPPYDISSNNLYGKKGDGHKNFNHEKFSNDCKTCPYKILISYNDNPEIRNLFSWANINTISAKHLMNSIHKQTNELVITNF